MVDKGKTLYNNPCEFLNIEIIFKVFNLSNSIELSFLSYNLSHQNLLLKDNPFFVININFPISSCLLSLYLRTFYATMEMKYNYIFAYLYLNNA